MSTAAAIEQESMGTNVVTFTVTNRLDEGRAKAGDISPAAVRRVTVEDALVDTGATTLCLPADLIAQLGLELLREVAISTGPSHARIYRDATISLLGRETTVECIELPSGARPLLGAAPLEMLGLEPDLKNRTLRVLPDQTSDTYLTVM